MLLYARTPARRTSQLVADLLLVAWLVLWVWAGLIVHDGTMALASPARQTDESASSMAGQLRDAGGALDDVPLIGDEVATPFDKAADASDGIAAAGRSSARAVEQLALVLGLAIALIPILVVMAFYLPGRVRFVREATAGARFLDSADDLDLFALRALANQPMRVLATISDDPAGDWRRQDAVVVSRLAELELRSVGLSAGRLPSA
ncbi:MAG: hypothetical protein AVDCRST_MAG60-1822 [uncultured Nocardioides sp.]|uniref:Uncharacterized protein n=1 Tax=uncultured Nocardioides sp. TaxID=198441 RepID=A0A6J4NYH4_9ACTN|nr:MAG: hypothetical protein AVDCRST_MAG60-1822 [uncultured Nocardioides sp.]